jgi:hypothetical protein
VSLSARWSLFGSGDQMEFWEVITRYAHPVSVASVHDMEEIQSDLGRVSENHVLRLSFYNIALF